MRKGFSLTAVASAMVLATGSAFALGQGAGFGFEQWSASSGTVTHKCEQAGGGIAGYTCSTIADGAGFKQLMITNDTTGETFIGTLVTDQTATGGATPGDGTNRLGFADESYVKMVFNTGGGPSQQTENGISAKQTLFEKNLADGTTFESKTEIETASITAKPISINQSLKNTGDATSAGDDFMSSFVYEASIDATTGVRTGFQMQLDQIAGLAANGGSAGDVQNFSLRERAGTMLTVAGGGTSTINMQGAVDPNTKDANGNAVAKTSLDYASGDDIKMVWLGQNVDLSSVTTGTTPTTQMGSLFGYLSFENKGAFGSTTATPEVMARFSLLDVSSGTNTASGGDAWAWDPQFGIKFGDPSGTQAPSGAPVMTSTINDPSGGLVTLP